MSTNVLGTMTFRFPSLRPTTSSWDRLLVDSTSTVSILPCRRALLLRACSWNTAISSFKRRCFVASGTSSLSRRCACVRSRKLWKQQHKQIQQQGSRQTRFELCKEGVRECVCAVQTQEQKEAKYQSGAHAPVCKEVGHVVLGKVHQVQRGFVIRLSHKRNFFLGQRECVCVCVCV